MLKETIIVLAFASLATSAEAAQVRGGTDTGFGTNINARNGMKSDDLARAMNYDEAEYESEINAASQPAAGDSIDDGINYRDKSLHNYQDPYLTNPRGYKSNENGQAAPVPKSNSFTILFD